MAWTTSSPTEPKRSAWRSLCCALGWHRWVSDGITFAPLWRSGPWAPMPVDRCADCPRMRVSLL